MGRYAWGDPLPSELAGIDSFDAIVASDVLYSLPLATKLHGALVDIRAATSGSDVSLWLSHVKRYSVSIDDGNNQTGGRVAGFDERDGFKRVTVEYEDTVLQDLLNKYRCSAWAVACIVEEEVDGETVVVYKIDFT